MKRALILAAVASYAVAGAFAALWLVAGYAPSDAVLRAGLPFTGGTLAALAAVLWSRTSLKGPKPPRARAGEGARRPCGG